MKKIDFESELKVLKENKIYRFSDLFFAKGIRWKSDRGIILKKEEYAETILKKYLQHKKGERDYPALKKIVAEYCHLHNPPTPSPSELVIHLRCGDIFDNTDPVFIRSSRQKTLIHNIFSQNKKRFINNDIKKVTVVTALHFGANDLNQKYFYSDKIYNDNIIFLKNFENKVNDFGYELNLVSNVDFDLDFCYMSHSHHFIGSVSQVSNIIKKCLPKFAKIYY